MSSLYHQTRWQFSLWTPKQEGGANHHQWSPDWPGMASTQEAVADRMPSNCQQKFTGKYQGPRWEQQLKLWGFFLPSHKVSKYKGPVIDSESVKQSSPFPLLRPSSQSSFPGCGPTQRTNYWEEQQIQRIKIKEGNRAGKSQKANHHVIWYYIFKKEKFGEVLEKLSLTPPFQSTEKSISSKNE